jgi:predicted esterase YcpF (UPF0227 family)
LKKVIYLHGFNSSPKSEKACLTQAFFTSEACPFELHIASFSTAPLAAIRDIEALVEALGVDNVAGFIGSSLGGYYSLYLHKKLSLPAVLINPALRPYELLSEYVGENTNPYTGERYIVESQHMAQLRSLDVGSDFDPQKLYLLTQTGDEVLDFQQAVTTLKGAKSWISAGGDHSFQQYSSVLPSIVQFFTDLS